MTGFNWTTLGFGALMAANDVLMMPLVKQIADGWNRYLLLIPIVLYAFDPIIFYMALLNGKVGMAVMNLTWNLISNILVTFMGLFLFKEVVSGKKLTGIVLSFIALFLLSYE
jgi:uncharacterized membrane protein